MGSLWQPEILQEAPVALRALVEGPTGRDAAAQLLFSPRDRTAVALCSSAIPPERAAAWVEGLLSHVQAQHAVAAASLPVSTLALPGSPLQRLFTALEPADMRAGTASSLFAACLLDAPCSASTTAQCTLSLNYSHFVTALKCDYGEQRLCSIQHHVTLALPTPALF